MFIVHSSSYSLQSAFFFFGLQSTFFFFNLQPTFFFFDLQSTFFFSVYNLHFFFGLQSTFFWGTRWLIIRLSASALESHYGITPFSSIDSSLAPPCLTVLNPDKQDKEEFNILWGLACLIIRLQTYWEFNNLWRLAWVRFSGEQTYCCLGVINCTLLFTIVDPHWFTSTPKSLIIVDRIFIMTISIRHVSAELHYTSFGSLHSPHRLRMHTSVLLQALVCTSVITLETFTWQHCSALKDRWGKVWHLCSPPSSESRVVYPWQL